MFKIHSNGCGRRLLEKEALERWLNEEIAEGRLDKDVEFDVFVSCIFNKIRTDESFEYLDTCAKNKTFISGCFPKAFEDYDSSEFAGSGSIQDTADNLSLLYGLSRFEPSGYSSSRVQIAQGCLGNCSYCAIKKSTGTLVSKPEEEILSEIDSNIQVHLMAEDTGAWGQDFKPKKNLGDLLDFLFNNGIRKVSIDNMDPFWLMKFFSEIERHKDRISSIIVAIQTFSNSLLKKMNRREIDMEKFLSILLSMKNTGITLYMISGYPEETDEEFEENLLFLKRLTYEKQIAVYLFQFYDHFGNFSSLSSEIKSKRISAISNTVRRYQSQFVLF